MKYEEIIQEKVIKIIKDNSEYVTHQGADCFSGSIINYLNYKKININSGSICSLYDGFSQKFDYICGIPSLRGEVYDSVIRFVENNAGIINIKKFDLDIEEAEKHLIEFIENDALISVEVNTDNFEYDEVFKQSDNWIHFVNVIGYDKDNFYISDGYVPASVPKIYEGKIDRKLLMNAWKKREFKHCLLDLNNFKNADFNDSNLIKKYLRSTLKNYLTDLSGGENYGHSAIAVFLKAIENAFYDPDFKEISQRINHNLKAHGFFSMRYCLLQQIRQFDDLAEEANEIEKIIKNYNLLCMLLLKAGFSQRENDLKKLLSFGNDVMELEKKVFSDLVCKL